MTVEAWVHCPESRAEALQVLVAQWSLRPIMGGFETYDAGYTDGLQTRGFFGALFDGRYAYFSPQHDGQERHGKVLRYDAHGPFAAASSWAACDASHTSGLDTRGYYGALFDGRYAYFVPRTDGKNLHTRVLRLDTQGEFKDKASWSAHDVGQAISYQGGAFDGRYAYFAPGYEPGPSGKVLRYDARGEFADPASYALYDAGQTSGLNSTCYDGALFDGRHVYFAPLAQGGIALRYDARKEFADPRSWEAWDASAQGLGPCVGLVFDGRYLYYVPYAHSRVVRFDTEAAFADPEAWAMYQAGRTSGMKTVGYDGGAFDGRYVYFVPFWEGEDLARGFHARVLRCDTQREFTAPESWEAADGAPNPGGFNGGAFDGRYLYFAPWRLGTSPSGDIVSHGQVMRYDTCGTDASFILKYMDCGHNGGLCGAVPGPSFAVNVPAGVCSARASRNPGPGWHHLAGTYDGAHLRLYVDGDLAGTSLGRGAMCPGRTDIAIGHFPQGAGLFQGTIDTVRLSGVARSARELRDSHAHGRGGGA
jgi:hypothetical protein